MSIHVYNAYYTAIVIKMARLHYMTRLAEVCMSHKWLEYSRQTANKRRPAWALLYRTRPVYGPPI